MHREQHNEGKSKKWLWITLTVAVIVLVGISAYLAGQLSSVKKEASSAKSVESSKVISSSSDSDSNNDEDTNNDTDDNNNTNNDTNNNKADKNTDNTANDGDIGRIPSLDVSTVCACLLVAPDWFKSNDVSFQEVNSNDGIIKDDKGNFVESSLNNQNNVTITYHLDNNGQQINKSVNVPLKQLYVDYYNTQKKRDEVNGYVNNLN